MLKWFAIFLLFLALSDAASEKAVKGISDRVGYLEAREARRCTFLAVNTPGGVKSVCVVE